MDSNIGAYSVFLRIKPQDVNNVDDSINSKHYSVNGQCITTSHVNKKQELIECNYDFVKVFLPSASQSDVFDAVVYPSLKDFFSGTESLIFSYGTSNSGKSFTMQGTPSCPGIIPRVLYSLFSSIEEYKDNDCALMPYMSSQVICAEEQDMATLATLKAKIANSLVDSCSNLDESLSGTTSEKITLALDDSPAIPCCMEPGNVCSIWISFYEFYNQLIYDLLRNDHRKPLSVHFDEEDGSYFPTGLTHLLASSWEEAFDLYRYGKKNLHMSTTLLNQKSSRSHCVFVIKLLTRPDDESHIFNSVKSFVICDLAGTERMHHTEGLGKEIVREMRNINASLLTLNKCLVMLKSESTKDRSALDSILPPYRDSKLTMILKKFLTGKGKLSMVANISQDSSLFFQTEQVLKMTSLAHKTRVRVDRNEELSFKFPKMLPKRRFSLMHRSVVNTPVTSLHAKPINVNIEAQLKAEILHLRGENEKLTRNFEDYALEMTNKLNNNEIALQRHEENSNKLKVSEARCFELETKLQIAESKFTELAQFNENLSRGLDNQESQTKTFIEMAREMDQKYRDYHRETSYERLDWQARLQDEKQKMATLLNYFKSAFTITSANPMQVAKEVISKFQELKKNAVERIDYLMKFLKDEFDVDMTDPIDVVKEVVCRHQETIAAALEEIEELKERISELERLVKERDNEVELLKGQVLELKEDRNLEDAYQRTLAFTERRLNQPSSPNADAEDRRGLCLPNNTWDPYQQTSSDDAFPLYVPPKPKSTLKKKKKKKKMPAIEDDEIPSFSKLSTADNDGVKPVRKAQKKLLGHAADHLGDNFVPIDQKTPESRLSPTNMLRSLRSRKKKE